jgi:hypothetical protein
MKNKIFLTFFIILFLTACPEPTPPPTYPFPSFEWINAPAIKVVIDGNTICIPRQFLNPDDEFAKETVKNADGTTKSITPKSAFDIEFTALLPELTGYTEEFIKNQYKDEKTQLHSKSILVKISLLNDDSVRYYKYLDKFKGFEEKIVVDETGFSTRMRNQSCASEVYTASPTIAISADKNCAFEELKFANPKLPNLIFRCWPEPGSDRCYSEGYSTIKNTTYRYSFDISQLPNFVSIHNKVEERVKKWTEDESCKKNQVDTNSM